MNNAYTETERTSLTVFIVDDHPLIVEALELALTDIDPNVKVSSAGCAEEAIHVFRNDTHISLILLDLTLPGAQGLDLLLTAREIRSDVPIVVLSADERDDTVRRALDAGAMGFISKRSQTKVLVGALHLVLKGGIYIPPQVLSSLYKEAPNQSKTEPDGSRPQDLLGLTDRQVEVLSLLVQGKSNKAIARELGIAEGTTKYHVQGILSTLRAANRTEALAVLSHLGVMLPHFPARRA